jgi:hypothetical protein
MKGELLDIDSDNDMVRDRASTSVLGLADIAPASAPALYVIDLTDDPRRLAHRLLTAHRCGCRPGQRRIEAYTAPSVRRGFSPSLPNEWTLGSMNSLDD